MIGENIKAIRKRQNMTQGELAKKYSAVIGRSKPVSGATISQFESSDNLSYNTIKALAKALGVSISEIIPDSSEEALRTIYQYGYSKGWQECKQKCKEALIEVIMEELNMQGAVVFEENDNTVGEYID